MDVMGCLRSCEPDALEAWTWHATYMQGGIVHRYDDHTAVKHVVDLQKYTSMYVCTYTCDDEFEGEWRMQS
jgi:hypothetical protein